MRPLGLLVLLYALSEFVFSLLTKVLRDPLGTAPTAIAAAAACWVAYLWISGQWWHLVPMPGPRRCRQSILNRHVVLCAVGSSAILISSTVAYSLPGVTLVLPVVLMKSGALLLAPLLDGLDSRRVPPRSIAVLGLALLGALASTVGKSGSPVAIAGLLASLGCAAVYLGGYAAKLRAIGHRRGDWPFFVAATTLTLAISLPAALVICLAMGGRPSASPLALLAGVASQGCGVFGGLILLGKVRDTHTALVPLHRCASLLAVVCATVTIAVLRHGWGPRGGFWHAVATGRVLSAGEAAGATLVACALWLKFSTD